MKKIFLIPAIFLFLVLSKFAFAFHDVEVANEDVAALGGLWTQYMCMKSIVLIINITR